MTLYAVSAIFFNSLTSNFKEVMPSRGLKIEAPTFFIRKVLWWGLQIPNAALNRCGLTGHTVRCGWHVVVRDKQSSYQWMRRPVNSLHKTMQFPLRPGSKIDIHFWAQGTLQSDLQKKIKVHMNMIYDIWNYNLGKFRCKMIICQ